MSLPGWYHDPGGSPGHYRYWDGSSWSEGTTTNPADPPPSLGHLGPGSSRAGGPASSSAQVFRATPRKVWLGIASIVSLVVVLALIWSMTRPPDDEDPPAPTPSASASPTTSTSSEPTSTGATKTSAELCADGNRRYLSPSKLSQVTHTGLAIDYPADWGFRLDISQFPWLEDPYPFGTIDGGGETAVITGRVPSSLATDTKLAVQQNWLCWATAGVLNDAGLKPEPTSKITEVTTNGVRGHELRQSDTTTKGEKVTTIIRAYESQSRVVVFIGYWNEKGATHSQLALDALDSIRPG